MTIILSIIIDGLHEITYYRGTVVAVCFLSYPVAPQIALNVYLLPASHPQSSQEDDVVLQMEIKDLIAGICH